MKTPRKRPAPTTTRATTAELDGRGGGKPSPARRARRASTDALVAEVHALRAALDEAVQQFHVRTAARLAEVERALVGGGPSGARPVRPSQRARAEMLADVRALKVKPRKGRIKDLVRLAELIEEMVDQLPV